MLYAVKGFGEVSQECLKSFFPCSPLLFHFSSSARKYAKGYDYLKIHTDFLRECYKNMVTLVSTNIFQILLVDW